MWSAVYLASMAIVNGAKTMDEIINTIKGGFMKVIRVRRIVICKLALGLNYLLQVQWITSPLAMVFAQKFLSPEVRITSLSF